MKKLTGFLFAAVIAGVAGSANASTLNIPFTPGSGNSNTNFIIDRNADKGIEVGIKAKERFVGDLPLSGTTYSAVSGESGPGLATWNIDFSWDLGSNWETSWQLSLGLDFDPGAGATDFSTFTFTPLQQITQGSQNPGFSFWGKSFDPLATGEYSFFARVLDANGAELAGAAGVVNVAPVPLPAGMPLALAGLGAFVWVRRRQKTA